MRRSGVAIGYFNPSCFPAARSSIDSRMRRSRVSGRLRDVYPHDEVTPLPWSKRLKVTPRSGVRVERRGDVRRQLRLGVTLIA